MPAILMTRLHPTHPGAETVALPLGPLARLARSGVKEDGDEHAANSLHLPRRYLDTRRRKHCRARRRRRGLSGCARHLSRRLRTLARHSHHLAAGCASDRGQPAPARGVEPIRSPTFREELWACPVSLRSGALVATTAFGTLEGFRDPAL